MQVEPIKPPLQAPGSKRLKLKCEEPLSNFAFKFNLRHYTQVGPSAAAAAAAAAARKAAATNKRKAASVGSSFPCSPRHPPHIQPSYIASNVILFMFNPRALSYMSSSSCSTFVY